MTMFLRQVLRFEFAFEGLTFLQSFMTRCYFDLYVNNTHHCASLFILVETDTA